MWASSSPPLGKEPCGSQRGDASRCDVKHERCFSRQSRIVTSSTPTSFAVSRWQPSLACQQFRCLAFISEKSSTRKSNTSQDHSCHKHPSTTSSFGATFPESAQTRSSAGWWASPEVLEMIALKELMACRHGLHQNVEVLCDHTVKIYQDNQVVCGALRKMSSFLADIKDLVHWSTKTRSVSMWSTFAVK
jgi:hypothetical protein